MHSFEYVEADDFRQVVRARRRMLGLTQAELAREAGISLRTLKSWEAGNLPVYMQGTSRLAAALELSLDQLVGTAPPPSRPLDLAPLAADLAELAELQAAAAAALGALAQRAALLAGGPGSAAETG